MAEKPVSPGIASSAQGPTLGSSARPSDPRFSPISLRRLLPPRLLAHGLVIPIRTEVGGLWVFEVQTRARAIELIEQDPSYRFHPRK